MTIIDLDTLSTVTGGAAPNTGTGQSEMLRSIDGFADQMRRSTGKQVKALARCDYQTTEDMASGDPARMAKAQNTNCRDLLAPMSKRYQ